MHRQFLSTLVMSFVLLGCAPDEPDVVRTTDTGPMGFDSGPTGFDAGPTGFDSGPTGFDTGVGFDSGFGFDSGIVMGMDAGDSTAMCLAMATNECERCSCTTCQSQLAACVVDPGCVAIGDCARTSGCRGIDCYGIPGLSTGPCTAVIDAQGGPNSNSAQLGTALNDCATGSCGC